MFKIEKNVNNNIILIIYALREEWSYMILFFIILLIICLIAIIALSRLEIKIENFNISNLDNKKNNEIFNLQISLKIFKLKWISINLNLQKLANLYVKQNIKIDRGEIDLKKTEKDMAEKLINNKKIKEELRKMKINLKKFDLKIALGVEDCIITSYLVAIASIIISNILPHLIKENVNECSYRINPIYNNRNLYNIDFDCIIDAKLVHIIYVIYLMRKKGEKNERTSNRKPYEYSYE